MVKNPHIKQMIKTILKERGRFLMNDPRMDAYCKGIDNAFLDFESKKCDSDELCKRLSIYCKDISAALGYKKKFNVIMIDGKNEFYGMSVYPSLSELDKVFKKIDVTSLDKFCNSWIVDIQEYTIEIDKNLFDKSIIAFNNRELTAMLLHELAHVAFHSTKAEVIYDSYKMHRIELKSGEKNATRVAQQIFYTIPTIVACGSHVYKVGITGHGEEFLADKILGMDEYKGDLYNATGKIVRTYGTSAITSESDQKQKADNLMKWCNLNILEISTRRRVLKNDIIFASAGTKSKMLRKAYVNLMTKLGIGFSDKYTNIEIATESVFDKIDTGELKTEGLLAGRLKVIDKSTGMLEHAIESAKNTVAMESFDNSRNKQNALPSDYDIDMIAIEIDKCQNHNDRIHALDLIYAKLEQIQEFVEYAKYYNTYNRYKTKTDQQIKKLNQLREKVLHMKGSGTNYSMMYVEYPKGYEG